MKARELRRSFPAICIALFVSLLAIFNQEEPMSVNLFYQVISIVIFSLAFVQLVRIRDNKMGLVVINAMMVGALVQSLFCIADFLFQNISYEEIVIRLFHLERGPGSNIWLMNGESFQATGTLGGVARTGGYIAICSSSFWYYLKNSNKIKKFLSIIGIIICGFALIEVRSTLGIAAFLVVHGYLFIRFLVDELFDQKEKMILNLSFLSSLFVGFYYLLFSGAELITKYENERVKNWVKMWNAFTKEAGKDWFVWLLGKGPSWFQDYGRKLANVDFLWEHNEQLSFLINFGILGTIVIWGGLFYGFGIRETRREDVIFKASIAASVVLSFGHFVFHQGTIAVVVMACFACLFSER